MKAASISGSKQVANYAKMRFYTTGTTPTVRKFPVVLSESHHLGEVEFEEKILVSTAIKNFKLKECSSEPLNGFPDVHTHFSPIPTDSDDIAALPSNSEIKVSITKDFDVIGVIKSATSDLSGRSHPLKENEMSGDSVSLRALKEQVQAREKRNDTMEKRHNVEIKELQVDVKDRDIDISKLQVDVASLQSRTYRIDMRNLLDSIREDMVGKPWPEFLTKRCHKDPKKAIDAFLKHLTDNRWKALWSNPAFQDLIVSPPSHAMRVVGNTAVDEPPMKLELAEEAVQSLPTGEDKDLLLESLRILNL